MILEEVRNLLVAHAAGVSGQTLFRSALPATPDDVVALYETASEPPMHVRGDTDVAIEFPRVQVISRSKSYDAARYKAEAIYRALDGFSGSLNGVGYGWIHALQSPTFLSRDDMGRVLIVCNYRVLKELSPLPP